VNRRAASVGDQEQNDGINRLAEGAAVGAAARKNASASSEPSIPSQSNSAANDIQAGAVYPGAIGYLSIDAAGAKYDVN
jgi:hypothetical protein